MQYSSRGHWFGLVLLCFHEHSLTLRQLGPNRALLEISREHLDFHSPPIVRLAIATDFLSLVLSMNPLVLILPGLWNSGPQHWQTQWEAGHPEWKRVLQRDWQTPDRAEWVETLRLNVAACRRPPILVAHSLGCALVAHWAQAANRGTIAGAFLVAPSDVDAPSYSSGTTGFVPMPMHRLHFPSLLVASRNDPYCSVARAAAFSSAWGSDIAWVGEAGHINADTGFGPWPDGERMLLDFCAHVQG